MFCIVAGVAAVLLGWVLPVYGVPAVNDSTWLAVIPAVAEHNMPVVVIVAARAPARRARPDDRAAAARRRRAWSSPVSVHRYGDQHRWS